MYRKMINGRHSPQIGLALTDRDWLPTRTVYSQKNIGKKEKNNHSWEENYSELLLTRLPRHIVSAKADSVSDTYDFNMAFFLSCE